MKRVIVGINQVELPKKQSRVLVPAAAHFVEAGSKTLHPGEVYGNPKKDADSWLLSVGFYLSI